MLMKMANAEDDAADDDAEIEIAIIDFFQISIHFLTIHFQLCVWDIINSKHGFTRTAGM